MINAKYKIGQEVSFKIIGDHIIKGTITNIEKSNIYRDIVYKISWISRDGENKYINIIEEKLMQKIVEVKEKIKISTVDDLLKLLPLENGYWKIEETYAGIMFSLKNSNLIMHQKCNPDMKEMFLFLNSVGFDNLEYVETKTIKSILEELWKHQEKFIENKFNYYICLDHEDKKIYKGYMRVVDRIGLKYFNENKIITSIQELKEINADFDDIVMCIKEMR